MCRESLDLLRDRGKILIYYILAIIITTTLVFEIANINPVRQILPAIFLAISVFLIIFSGLRDQIGTDYVLYERLHTEINSGYFNPLQTEPAFILIFSLINNFNFALLLVAIFSVGIKLREIYNQCEMPFVALLVYFSYCYIAYDMGTIRQGLALALSILSIKYITQKNLRLFLATTLSAAICHYSAIIFVFSYFFANKNISRLSMYSLSIASITFGYLDSWKLIINFLTYLPDWVPATKYLSYLDFDEYFTNDFDVFDLKRFVFLVVFSETIRRNNLYYDKYRALINIFFIGVIIFYSFKSFTTLSGRGSMYYYTSEIFLASALFYIIKNKWHRFTLLIILIAYTTYNLTVSINIDDSKSYYNLPYYPYKSILE